MRHTRGLVASPQVWYTLEAGRGRRGELLRLERVALAQTAAYTLASSAKLARSGAALRCPGDVLAENLRSPV